MQTITVTYNDGTTSKAKITPVVQVAFERHFNTGVTAMSDKDTMRMEYIYWLAWHSCTAGRKDRPSFDDWLETVTEIEHNAGDSDDADPLVESPPSGGSLPSPSSPEPE